MAKKWTALNFNPYEVTVKKPVSPLIKMQILAVFFLAALVGCYGDDESACGAKTESCLEPLHGLEFGTTPTDKICRETANAIECLEQAADGICDGDDLEDGLKLNIEQMKDMSNLICRTSGDSSDDDETQECIDDNKVYIQECVLDSLSKVLDELENQDNVAVTEERIACGVFMTAFECAVERSGEKCGPEGAMLAMRQATNIPVEILEACQSIGIYLHNGGPAVSMHVEEKKK